MSYLFLSAWEGEWFYRRVCGWIGHLTLLFRLIQPLGWQEWKIIVEDIIVDLSGPEISPATSGYTKEVEDMLKMLSPSTTSFIKNLPAIEGRHTSLLSVRLLRSVWALECWGLRIWLLHTRIAGWSVLSTRWIYEHLGRTIAGYWCGAQCAAAEHIASRTECWESRCRERALRRRQIWTKPEWICP